MNNSREKLLALSPMAGYTDSAFRRVVKSFCKSTMTFSEMVSAEGLVRNDRKTFDLAKFHDEERPISIQIFGFSPESVGKSVKIIQEKFNPDEINLNFACPAKKILKNESGGFLLNKKDLAFKIAESAVLSTSLPVSVKTRLGFSEDSEIFDFAKNLEQIGISSICIHGRTVKEEFKNTARWENIYKLKEELKIPVFGNGDIVSTKDTEKVQNLDGVFIGRGALGKPWLIANFTRALEGKSEKKLSLKEKLEVVKKHVFFSVKEKGEKRAFAQLRSHFSYYFRSFPGASGIRRKAVQISNYEEFEDLIKLFQIEK